MLKSLKLHGIGPVKNLEALFAERLNVLTGDNGLGKSFLLDLAFWTLTGTWPGGRVAIPERNGRRPKPSIEYQIEGKRKGTGEKSATYDVASQSWKRDVGKPPMPGLVVYAAVDGSFAVWDPARNYWRENVSGQVVPADQPRAFQFTPETLANELKEDGRVLSSGLVNDWANWYYRSANGTADARFKLLAAVVAQLAHPDEPMTVAPPQRVFVDDSREFPVIRMPYGPVAFPHWSAGVRRIVSLAYLLVWAWDEHRRAAELRGESPTDRLVLLIDEMEAHLHPKWQRVILPALLEVAESLHRQVRVQVLTATHSPLVLASLEPLFDEDRDRLFWFDLHNGEVSFRLYPWAKHGDVVGWLTSPIFGLKEARSREAEVVLGAAEAYMGGDTEELPEDLRTREAIESAMRRVLPGDDPIWSRWLLKTRGGIPQ
jgi:hypothetical protein